MSIDAEPNFLIDNARSNEWSLAAPQQGHRFALGVSERTVELERAWILKLFDVKNAIELAVLITEAQARIDPLLSVQEGR